jgi:hypothetical protein
MSGHMRPQRRRATRLDRYDIDRIARAVASGRRFLGTRLDGLADSIAAQMTAKLAAAGVPMVRATPARHVVFDRDTWDAIIARVSKHLPVVAVAATDASTRPH